MLAEKFKQLISEHHLEQFMTELLATYQAHVGWEPISTAPKDGTEIIVMDGMGGIHGAMWTTFHGTTGWFHHRNYGWLPSAKKWMPIITGDKS